MQRGVVSLWGTGLRLRASVGASCPAWSSVMGLGGGPILPIERAHHPQGASIDDVRITERRLQPVEKSEHLTARQHRGEVLGPASALLVSSVRAISRGMKIDRRELAKVAWDRRPLGRSADEPRDMCGRRPSLQCDEGPRLSIGGDTWIRSRCLSAGIRGYAAAAVACRREYVDTKRQGH